MVPNENPGWEKPSIKTLVYLLLPLLFLLIVFPAVTQPNHGFISDYHDALCLILPDFFLIHNPLALWNNQWITGLSDIASMNSDRFYPLSFPFFFLTQDIFIIDFILLLHLYIAFLAFYKLGSLLVKNSELLLIFSLGYMFSGVLLSRISIGHIFFVYAMAWIPLLFYFFFRITYRKEPTAFNIIALALCEAMLVFSAATYYLFFCNVILAVFFFYWLLSHKLSRSQIYAVLTSTLFALAISAIKWIPVLSGMAYIQRIDLIDPLGDGGLLENNFASFVFGTPIDTVFGPYETMALIGIIPVLFAIIALLWGDRELTVPSFYAIVFTLVWADGGRILLSFIHLFPLISSFRNAGRVFGAIMPIILLLSLYGVSLVLERFRKGEPFTVSENQKKAILYGIGILAVIKVLELPWAGIPSPEAALAVILILGFILLVYLDKVSVFNLQCYFTIALLLNILVIAKNFAILNGDVLIKGLLIAVVLIAALFVFNRAELDKDRIKSHFFVAVLIIGIILSVTGNISVLKPTDPDFETSPALKVIEKIQETPPANPQVWVYDSGWPIQHMDFTYLYIKNGIHPMRAFYSYVPLNTPPLAFKMNGTDYFTADYIVDTAYLENGNQNLPNVTFRVDNMSVYQPDHVLSNVFVVRNDQLVPVRFEKFTPDEIIVTGQFRQGDIAVLKTAFYPGWKMNSQDTEIISNMPGNRLQTDAGKITFRYDPFDAKAGALLTVVGILGVIAFYSKRKEAEKYLKTLETEQPVRKVSKKGKSRR